MQCPSLADVVRFSPFAARALAAMRPGAGEAERLAAYEALLGNPPDIAAWGAELGRIADGAQLRLRLREMRRSLLLYIVGANATGRIDYADVVRLMSDFAETAVQRAYAFYAGELAERFGVPSGASGTPQDMLIVGMGKLGGRELNVSSDIDLVFLYDEAGETRPSEKYPNARRTITVQEFYERLARRFIPALNDIEGPGFVFRVDMRLRPNGDAGPIVCSSDMLEQYLYTQGRDWERFAWLKGRIVNRAFFASEEDFAQQSKDIDELVRPFVFRKYLDFGAIASLTKLHEIIRAETARRDLARGGREINVKLGRGGIREIEFLTQTQQVIRGGRDPQLQGRSTLPMLRALAEDSALDSGLAAELSDDYVFLRNVEHAIQYVNDEQTQMLPKEGERLEAVAGLLGVPSGELWTTLSGVRERVASAFDSVFHIGTNEPEQKSTLPPGWETGTHSAQAALAKHLSELGYEGDLDELVSRIARLTSPREGAHLSEVSLERMQKVLPMIIERCPKWQDPKSPRIIPLSELLSRYLTLLEAIASRSTYAALLAQYPKALERVGRVLAASRWSADYIVRHPIVLDELVDGRIREMDDFTPVDWSEWSDRLHAELENAQGDQEQQMNLLRDAHHAAVFQLLVADLDGRFTVERLADQLSALADAVLEAVIELAWQSLPKRHCDRPKFAVIGYGKLGGKELGYASDLDLVFMYDDPDPEADMIYARLVRRMMSWLTLQTYSGKLFDVDLRLRPNGESGLAVCSFDMFQRYQRNADGTGAWFWEHQALTRARFAAGSPEVGRKFEEERRHILMLERDPAESRKNIIEMRRRMLEGHPNRTELFDIKHDRGGMVDVEFTVQHLVLTGSREHPEMTNNFGNILLLETAARIGLVDPALAAPAVKAYRRYRQLQHEIRLNSGDGVPVRVPAAMLAGERQAVLALWRSVFLTDEPQRETLRQSAS
jgi:[glutamine synthetase] adenylyltransferase / [glutamine synthetase]-adenylyl-L-tyrosine phosphorylase